MLDLLSLYGWRHVEPWVLAQHAESPKEKLLELFGEIPAVVLFWKNYEVFNSIQPALQSLGCRLDLFADDLHLPWGGSALRAARPKAFGKCDRILTPYAYVFDEYYPELREQKEMRWIPHEASPDFVFPFNDEPENKIPLSGFVGAPYPLRTRMKELAGQGCKLIERREHPGYSEDYDYSSDTSVGPGYAATIRRFRACFTDAATIVTYSPSI